MGRGKASPSAAADRRLRLLAGAEGLSAGCRSGLSGGGRSRSSRRRAFPNGSFWGNGAFPEFWYWLFRTVFLSLSFSSERGPVSGLPGGFVLRRTVMGGPVVIAGIAWEWIEAVCEFDVVSVKQEAGLKKVRLPYVCISRQRITRYAGRALTVRRLLAAEFRSGWSTVPLVWTSTISGSVVILPSAEHP